jgi:Tol biopolymer transport system component
MPDYHLNQQDSNWSPDGTSIAFAGAANDAATGDAAAGIRVLNLANHQISLIPGSQKLFSPRWSPDGRYIAAMASDSGALLLFDFQTQTWTEVARGTFAWPNWSTDGKSIYVLDFTGTGGVDRVRISDHNVERVLDLKDFTDTGHGGGFLSLVPDGSPLLLRDRGTQDIYALDWHE